MEGGDKDGNSGLINRCQARGLSPKTRRWYLGMLEPFGQFYPELPQAPEAIEEFLGACVSNSFSQIHEV